MATYEYTCDEGHNQEDQRSILEGPKPEQCPVCGGKQRIVYHSSLLVFGHFLIGDDDFSRRYHLNGQAGQYGGKANRSQGKTNVNAHLRKHGTAGIPLELNPDINPKKSWDTKMGAPPGVDPSSDAPIEMQTSSARGIKIGDED